MNRLKRERGVSLVIVAMVMFVLLGVAAFVVDFGFNYVQRNRLQNAVDAAALAGIDRVYRASNFKPSNFPASFEAEARDYAIKTLQENGVTYVTDSDEINVNWWNALSPSGKFKYPAVQVTLKDASHYSPLFFGKIFNNPSLTALYADATATAVTAYPAAIYPKLPFVITYCTLLNGWDFVTGEPKITGYIFRSGASTGASNRFNPLYNCVAEELKGENTSDPKILKITGPEPNDNRFQKLAAPVPPNVSNAPPGSASVTYITDTEGYFSPGETEITAITPQKQNGKTCESLPCTLTLKGNIGTITPTDNFKTDSGPLGNWSALQYDENNSGGSNAISNLIPPVASGISVPLVRIGQEILVIPGGPNTLYQKLKDCFDAGTCKDKLAIPVVNGIPCLSGSNHYCPATSETDTNFPLTGVPISALGSGLNTNLPVIGSACIDITAVESGSEKYFEAKLTTGCHITGIGGGISYFGVLLPPSLGN